MYNPREWSLLLEFVSVNQQLIDNTRPGESTHEEAACRKRRLMEDMMGEEGETDEWQSMIDLLESDLFSPQLKVDLVKAWLRQKIQGPMPY